MNKVERMQAVFAGQEPDRVPAGFWFHYPQGLSLEEHNELYRQHWLKIGKLKAEDEEVRA